MWVFWLAFLLFLVLCFAAVPVLAEGDSVAFCLDGEIISTAQAGEITLPEAPALERGRVFIGWRLIQNGEEVIRVEYISFNLKTDIDESMFIL